jgi:hypothetical protein
MHLVAGVFVLALVAAAACDRKNPTAPAPTQPAVTVTALSITGPDVVLTGASTAYVVSGTLSDGTARTVSAAWTGSNPGVASVDGDGRLEARSHGSIILTAQYEGRSVSKNVQVVNSYGGKWEGTFVIRACTDSGDFTDHDGGWCAAGPGRIGTVVRGMKLMLVQSGTNFSEVTGTFDSFDEPITGVVTGDGRLTLAGTFNVWDWDHEVILGTVQVRGWEAGLSTPGVMTGRWSERLVSRYFRVGTADTERELLTMVRLTASESSASR